MMHTYTSFWRSFFSFGKTASHATVRYSVTLSTYVFLHIMIFYAQLPDLIPSYFKKSGGGSSLVSDIGSGLSTVGSFAKSAENTASNAAQGAQSAMESAASTLLGSGAAAASTLLGSGAAAASGIGNAAASKIGDLGSRLNTPKTDPAPHPAPHRKGGASMGAIGTGLGAVASGASGAIGSLQNSMNPLANLSKYLPRLPGLGSLSAVGDALSSPFAGTVFGALGNIIVAIIRFCLSHYLVNIAAFLIAFYLLWYSFFGIFWFSKLGLFSTMKEIDTFILKHSMDYVYETCVSTECKNRTIWERIKEFFTNITRFSFPLIFYITIFFILINSCFEYTNATTGMHSSPYIKYGMLTSSIIAIVLVAVKGYISFIHKKI
jgi:hypothetical protein